MNPFQRKFAHVISDYPRLFDESKFPASLYASKFMLALVALAFLSSWFIALYLTSSHPETSVLFKVVVAFSGVILVFGLWIAVSMYEMSEYKKIDASMSVADREWIATVLRDYHLEDKFSGDVDVLKDDYLKPRLVSHLRKRALSILSDDANARVFVLRYILLDTSVDQATTNRYSHTHSFSACSKACIDYLENLSPDPDMEVKARLEALPRLKEAL